MFVLFYIRTYVGLIFTRLGGLHMYAMLFATSFKIVVILLYSLNICDPKMGFWNYVNLVKLKTYIRPLMSIILIIVVCWNMIIASCVY
jgi:hypothetical protein